jgi:hypothetical protein
VNGPKNVWMHMQTIATCALGFVREGGRVITVTGMKVIDLSSHSEPPQVVP